MNHLLCRIDKVGEQPHSYEGDSGGYVRPMQQIIVGWMSRQLDVLGWSAERWAREAGLAPTTVTRAMSEGYTSVSSLPTLHALARAASVPSVLDFLEGQSTICTDFPVLFAILEEVLPAAGCRLSDEQLRAAATAIGKSISGMLAQPSERRHDEQIARAIARMTRSRMWE